MRMLSLGVVTLFLAAPARAEDYRVTDTPGFNRAVPAARPGDRILLAPGDYGNNFYFSGVHGEAARPIVIAALDPKKPPRLVGPSAALHISGASYLELRDLVISGSSDNGLNIDDARNPRQPAHHITLRNIRVMDIGPKGNSDGIKLSGLDDFKLIDCTVERWGSSGSAIDMVGCHRGTIQNCSFRTGGENAVQMKGGSADITVARCRFEDCGDRAVNIGGFTGFDEFRPPLAGFPVNGRYEAKDIRVEGCTFLRGEAAVAFVNVDGAVVRYNTFYLPQKYVIRILQERVAPGFIPCRNGVFEKNVVVFRTDKWATGGVNVGADTLAKTFKFADNVWYCEDQPGRSAPQLPAPETDGVIGQDPRFKDPAKGNFEVPADSPARGRGAAGLPKDAGKKK
jgi:hypothetical protein